MTSDGCG